MKKYILLDIDGVMVSAAGWKPVEFDSDGFYKFNFLAQKKLDWLLQETGARIILITSHRNKYSTWEWHNVFRRRFEFLNSVQSIDDLNTNKTSNRLDDVLGWVNVYGHNSRYVIIDDDSSLESLPANIKNHWVKTYPTIGLNEDTAKKALTILNTL